MQMIELFEVLDALLRDPGQHVEGAQDSMNGFDSRVEIAAGLLPQHVTILHVVFSLGELVVMLMLRKGMSTRMT